MKSQAGVLCFKSRSWNYKSKCTYYKRTELQQVDTAFVRNNSEYISGKHTLLHILWWRKLHVIFSICKGYFIFKFTELNYKYLNFGRNLSDFEDADITRMIMFCAFENYESTRHLWIRIVQKLIFSTHRVKSMKNICIFSDQNVLNI